jgi:hypothetical protein
MDISLSGRINGFKKWSSEHPQSSNDDDIPGGATPIAVAVPPTEDLEAMRAQAHRPWRVPGIGTSL